MKSRNLIAAIILAVSSAFAQIPQHLNHQGRVSVQGVNFSGTGQFKFALVDATNLNTTATATRMTGTPIDGIGMLLVGNPGSGYLEPPTVTITDPTGTGATAEATIENGIITAITVANQGSDYSPSPTVTLSAPPPNIQYFSTWSNDQTSMSGGEPTAAISIPVVNGLYSVQLGNTAAGMSEILPGVFHGQRYLRVWFSDGVNPFQQLNPDQPLATAPYAFRAIEAETVPDGAITYGKLGVGAVVGDRIGNSAIMPEHLNNGAVTAAKIAAGAVGATQLAPSAISPLALDTGVGAPAPGQVLSYTNEGLRWSDEGISLPYTSDPLPPFTKSMFNVQTTASGTSALRGVSTLADGVVGRSSSSAQNYAGVYGLNNSTGTGVYGYSAGGNGVIGQTDVALKSGVLGTSIAGNGVSGNTTAAGHSGVYGSAEGETGVGGYFYNTTGDSLRSVGRTSLYGLLYVHDSDFRLGSAARRGEPGRALVDWRAAPGAPTQLYLNFGNDWDETVIGGSVTRVAGILEAQNLLVAGNGAQLRGNVIIGQQASSNTLTVHGRTTTRSLEITGGADLAEPFAMKEGDTISKGAVVVISEDGTGTLEQSTRAYDTRVAGIVSGANGIKPGISLHQEGVNDHGHNVALTGRVYCLCDAEEGAIKPGDMLTTSATAGHAMKASDLGRRQGAILGKAMSALPQGKKGHVLVLVTLQ